MPYGLLVESDLIPRLSSYRSEREALNDGHFGYWVWETICQISPKEDEFCPFENVWVLEGGRGLIMTSKAAAQRGLKVENSVPVILATYDSPHVNAGDEPTSRLPLFLKLVIRDEPPVQSTDSDLNDLDNVCVIGLCDLLQVFDVFHDGNPIEADEDGELAAWEKRLFDDDLVIVKKSSSDKACLPL